jgi:hypothetical protein
MEYFELPVADIRTDDRDRKRVLTPVILDGAPVPFNLAAVLHDLGRIRELAGFCAVVFRTERDKEAFEMLDLLRQSRVDVIICTSSTSGPQPWAPDELRRFAEELGLAATNSTACSSPLPVRRSGLVRVHSAEAESAFAGLLISGSSGARFSWRCVARLERAPR